ncbi:hypothetical protein A2867_04095 [Candidatus Daviesbacteria bacterium RIFCSPHIGHO2_01_FULL_40_11]|uniref:Uncharacterized protein n=1 Tax=Candidatus Daviesbacteria bacterium RIFCSPHIGHO2_01_FULL_40_11 TaxID=1797762 RepID=A0A1F5JHQ8_9BACT|nr:MAG: hypothetical protein A2867_04095 [Candidatus Daviesbacteria bacterium RIFCSPHIGHO2_01_FULL_40_11]OGE62850.1 MAG: hypothetical protein A2964_00690 [Candidatus Daviesbacteria bacterium RIFCSPLOWO2_01_FULL_40_27]
MNLRGVERGELPLTGIPGADKTTKAPEQAEEAPTVALKMGIIRFSERLYEGLGRVLTDGPIGMSDWV